MKIITMKVNPPFLRENNMFGTFFQASNKEIHRRPALFKKMYQDVPMSWPTHRINMEWQIYSYIWYTPRAECQSPPGSLHFE